MAPKRAFGGVLRPFGGGSRGPNRERASVFSGAGRGRAGGSAVEPGRDQRVQRWGPGGGGGGAGGGPGARGGGGPACSAARDRGGTGSSEVQTGRAGRRVAKKVFRREDAPAARTQKSVPRGRCAAARTHTGTKKTDLGPFTSISATLLCYPTGCCSGILTRCPPSHNNGPALREPVSFAGDFRQHVLLQQPVCLRFRSARRSGVTTVKASAIRSFSRSAARRSGLSRLAAGISAVRVAPRESLRPPPGSQFSAAGVTVLSRPGSRPSAARNLPSLLLAPSAAGVTAPPRQYGRPPAAGESPASSSRRASPARDSTAYRPAP